MQPPNAHMEHVVRVARHLADTALGPWGGAAACINAYEASIRSAAQAQLDVARAFPMQPARSIVARCADLTRDVGAVQVSTARWIFDA